MLRKIGIIAVLSLIVAAVAAVPALAVGPTETTRSGGLHFVGQPDATATKTDPTQAVLTATGEVAGAGGGGTATLSSTAEVTTGCINRGSQGQQPSGLQREDTTVTGSVPFTTRNGRGTFTVSTNPVTVDRDCPDGMTPVLVSVNFTDVLLTIEAQTGTITATFPDIDP
jgi:hypothetical protein